MYISFIKLIFIDRVLINEQWFLNKLCSLDYKLFQIYSWFLVMKYLYNNLSNFHSMNLMYVVKFKVNKVL